MADFRHIELQQRVLIDVSRRDKRIFRAIFWKRFSRRPGEDSFERLAMLYPVLKLVHILSATILFGGGIFAALLGTIVFGSRKIKLIADVAPHIVKVEFYLTTLSTLVQIITGLWLASLLGFSVLTGWLGWALILLCVAAVCWILGVWLQHRMVDLAKKAIETNSELSAEYETQFKNWTFLGVPSTAAMIGIFYLMVVKSV